jgi:hypothetical protein
MGASFLIFLVMALCCVLFVAIVNFFKKGTSKSTPVASPPVPSSNEKAVTSAVVFKGKHVFKLTVKYILYNLLAGLVLVGIPYYVAIEQDIDSVFLYLFIMRFVAGLSIFIQLVLGIVFWMDPKFVKNLDQKQKAMALILCSSFFIAFGYVVLRFFP